MKGNRGEWSELYAFLKLLADGKLYSADGALNAIPDKSYPILTIFRDDSPERLGYVVDHLHKCIRIAGKQTDFTVPQDVFESKSKELLAFIRDMGKGTEECTAIMNFLQNIGIDKIKAKSQDKADIRIIIHDLRTGAKPELGYSIKSRVGGNTTIINTSGDGSNFRYIVSGFPHEEIKHFNSLKYFREKFKLLESHHANVTFDRVVSPNFASNLTMLDYSLPAIIAQSLLFYYSGVEKKLKKICRLLEETNPIGLDLQTQPLMYEYKLKQFLLAFALGMTPATIWNGRFNANGGYIIVKENGDIVCYHFFDRNDLEDYLFNESYFDTPSIHRHNHGQLELANNGDLFLKLNIQVRFV